MLNAKLGSRGLGISGVIKPGGHGGLSVENNDKCYFVPVADF